MEIEVRNLTKVFGTLRANDGISLRFGAGQIHGVLGENGAGKSTLMKLLAGFLRRDAGDVLLDGRPAALGTPAASLDAGIGMVHQDPLDVPAFSALEFLYCGSRRAALPNRAAARQALLDEQRRLGFSVPPDGIVGLLTVGQRQQLAIIKLLVGGTRVLILDEPTTGITAAQADALFAALRTLTQEGKTVLFVSHKLAEVESLCTSVSVLRAGRVVGTQMAVPQPQSRLLSMMFGDRDQAPDQLPVTLPPAPAPVTPPSATAPTPVWQLAGVSLRGGPLLLHDLNLSLAPGSITGLAGLEGSGQQLVLRALGGLLRPVAGRVHVAGSDMTGAPVADFLAADVQYLPADRMADGVIWAFSLADHMALLAPKRGLLVDRAAATAAAEQAIAAYNIKATPTTPIVALSGGNQQRAMLAMLPNHCTGLLLEQPTRGLDVASARGIWGRLQDRCTQGTAVVFASADLDELLAYSDQVLVFFGGKVSPPIPRAELSESRLAELIGGVGFVGMNDEPDSRKA